MICAASMSGPFAGRDDSSVHAQLQLTLLDRLREQHDGLAALDLEYRRLQRIDLAVGTEFHRSPKRHDIEFRQFVAHFIAVKRAGALDRDLEQRAANRRRSLAVIRIALVLVAEQLHKILGRTEDVLAFVALGGMPPGSAG